MRCRNQGRLVAKLLTEDNVADGELVTMVTRISAGPALQISQESSNWGRQT